MNKEELKQESKEYADNILKDVNCTLGNPRARYINSLDIEEAYQKGAEPREKRITELEKKNERLTVSYETLKLHDEEEIGMLKSENAELKGLKDVATLIRANNDTVTTLMQLNNMLVSKSQQLIKAKEIIRDLLSWEDRADYDYNEYEDIKRKAENLLLEE